MCYIVCAILCVLYCVCYIVYAILCVLYCVCYIVCAILCVLYLQECEVHSLSVFGLFTLHTAATHVVTVLVWWRSVLVKRE